MAEVFADDIYLDYSGTEEKPESKILSPKINLQPNPCTNSTNFVLTLPEGTEFNIDIFDALGREIRTMNAVSSGNQDFINWDRKNNHGLAVSTGVYLYRFTSNAINQTGKIVVR